MSAPPARRRTFSRPDSLPSAPRGAQSDPLPTAPGGTAPPTRRGEPTAGDRHRGPRYRFLRACVRRAAAALMLGRAAIRDSAPAGARVFPASGGRVQARPARPGSRRRGVAGALAWVLLGFAALLAVPQTAHAQAVKEIWSSTLTTAPVNATSTSVFGFGGPVLWKRRAFWKFWYRGRQDNFRICGPWGDRSLYSFVAEQQCFGDAPICVVRSGC